MPEDVLREQARVERSEGIAPVFPVWWWSMPAILKGWWHGRAGRPGRRAALNELF